MEAAILDRPEQIAAFRLSMVIRALDMEVNTGMKLTSRMPRLKDIKAQYGVSGGTKAKVLGELRKLQEAIEAGTAYYEVRNGICHFSPGRGS